MVTPLVGVWIEIFLIITKANGKTVTPLVGVWIEIMIVSGSQFVTKSLPSWECGLKWQTVCDRIPAFLSLPSWECGLKLYSWELLTASQSSLPSWECGLKS